VSIAKQLMDLSLQKIINRTKNLFGMGPNGLESNNSVENLLGLEQFNELRKMPRFSNGLVKVRDTSIYFNDPISLVGMLDEIFVRENYKFSTGSAQPYILDCGANIGIGVIYLKLRFPNSIIHAFEPDPVAFQLLKKNIEANGLVDVYLHNQAVNFFLMVVGAAEFQKNQARN
jgi:hypothetical protein